MNKKDLITGAEFPPNELKKIIDLAISFKNGGILPDLAGQTLTLIFANPSLRTRLSFESGMKKMKGNVNVLSVGDTWNFEYKDGVTMNADKQEHIKDAARVISKYTDLIGMRKFDSVAEDNVDELKKDEAINQLAKHATVPVINMESNMFHPCQSMADMMTMVEHFQEVKNKKYVLTWAPHPKSLPLATPHSQILTPALFGMDVTLVHPEGFDLDKGVIELAKEKADETGGSLHITHDQSEAFKDADVIVAKSWSSKGQAEDWIVNEKKMALTNNAVFMHCLPVRRNVVVTDGVLDSPQSLIIQEAENRMWSQMAIIHYLLTS
ncbi:MAG: N-acetylornithine carbamoyltransferase [Patescibacteria group bacterium]